MVRQILARVRRPGTHGAMADDDLTAADAEIEEMQKKVAEMEEEVGSERIAALSWLKEKALNALYEFT